MRKILSLFEKGLMAIATLALVAMMVTTSVDAIGRYIFNSPLRGNLELTGLYFMVILVFATLSQNYARNVHVRLDVFSHLLKDRLGRNYTRAIALICLPVFAYFAWYAVHEALDKFIVRETRMGAIPFPIYLSYVWLALGAVTLTLRFALDVISPEDNEAQSPETLP